MDFVALFGSEDDDGYVRDVEVLPDALQQFHAVHLGHHQVADDEVGMILIHLFQALFAVVGGEYRVFALQLQAQHVTKVDIVFDEE